jgi:arylesterase/paraoxonase
MSRRLSIVVVVLVVIVAAAVLRTLWLAGQFRTLEPHFDGTCVPVEGIAGAEDITIHPRTGVAYLSAYDRRAAQAGEMGGGGIFAYDLGSRSPRVRSLTPEAAPDFHPHGISLHVSRDGPDVLFVINHAAGRHTIEVYEVGDDLLRHRETLSDPLLLSPNDLVAVDSERFYVTNDHGNLEGFRRTLEEYLRLPLSNVVYYDGSQFREAAGGLQMANGINLSPDGQTLYVGSTIGRAVFVYDRDGETSNLVLREEVPLESGVDNIEVDAGGILWIGSHPKLLDVVAHASTPTRLAPSQVFRLEPRKDGSFDIEEVYLDLGEELSAASVAAVYRDRMIVGPIYDSKFLDCRFD